MKVPAQHPQEIEVWYILPAIRKELVSALKEKGKSQKDIAKLLNITEAAVSQYVSEKRAKEIIFPQEVKDFIHKTVSEIKDATSAFHQIQRINEFIKKSKALCQLHAQIEGNLKGCDVCYKK
ncbi:MAG TPA: helix-turn-helix domain-containing protein [Candidatus Nanoarchaeia archaeon]|nr:helix-turn-helix domain-containing protein [Candidatus Nanoarchaeia archaeon]